MGAALFACCAINLCECAVCLGCQCFSGLVNATLPQAARFAHFLIIIATLALATIIGENFQGKVDGYSSQFTTIDLKAGCAVGYENNCVYQQLVYRATFSCVILFTVLALLAGLSDYINRSLWILKFSIAIGVFVAFWWGDNSFFSGWAEVARVISFIYLLIQALLLLDFCHDIHDMLMDATTSISNEDDKTPYITYLFLSAGGLTCVIVGLVYLFKDYTGCDMGMFYTILTLVMGVITMIVSLLDVVQKGLLTPCLMFAYSVFICWYALLSNPHKSCNPFADSSNAEGAAPYIVVITFVVMMYCVVNGTKILNIFNPEGEGVMLSYANKNNGHSNGDVEASAVTTQPAAGVPSAASSDSNSPPSSDIALQSSGTPHERAFFHILMVLLSCYVTMILTNWGSTNGGPPSHAHTSSNESMWLKIVSQWVFLLLYCRVLQVAYHQNKA
eukprot:gene4047-5789_t